MNSSGTDGQCEHGDLMSHSFLNIDLILAKNINTKSSKCVRDQLDPCQKLILKNPNFFTFFCSKRSSVMEWYAQHNRKFPENSVASFFRKLLRSDALRRINASFLRKLRAVSYFLQFLFSPSLIRVRNLSVPISDTFYARR